MVGINIKQELKDKLDSLKAHDRDSYGMVIEGLVLFYKDRSGVEDLPKKFVGKTASIHEDVSEGTEVDPKEVVVEPKEVVVEPEMDVAEETEEIVGEVVDATVPEEDIITDDKQ